MSDDGTDRLAEWVRASAGDTDDCPSPGELLELASGQLAAEREATVRRHLEDGCARCDAELELARSFLGAGSDAAQLDVVDARVSETLGRLLDRDAGRDTGAAKGPLPFRRRRAGGPSWSPWALAAAALVVAAIGLSVLPGPWGRPALPERATAPTRGDELRVTEPVGDLTESPTRIEWTTVEAASRYRVRLFRPGDELVWETSTPGTAVTLQQEQAPTIASRVRYVVRVEALAGDGTVIARSDSAAFVVIRDPQP